MRALVFQAVVLSSLLAGCARHHESVSAPAPARTAYPDYPYLKPLTSLGAKFGALPQPVRNTIRAEAGLEDLADVLKETTADRVYYKIIFRAGEVFPPLYIAPDGSVLYPDLTLAVPAPKESENTLAVMPLAVRIEDLPPLVAKTVRDRAANAEIVAISREALGQQVVYVLSFKNPEHFPKLTVFLDGSALPLLAP